MVVKDFDFFGSVFGIVIENLRVKVGIKVE